MSSLLNLRLLRESSFRLYPFLPFAKSAYSLPLYLPSVPPYLCSLLLRCSSIASSLCVARPSSPPFRQFGLKLFMVLMIDPLLPMLLELLLGVGRMRSNGKNFFNVSSALRR